MAMPQLAPYTANLPIYEYYDIINYLRINAGQTALENLRGES